MIKMVYNIQMIYEILVLCACFVHDMEEMRVMPYESNMTSFCVI